MNKPIIAVDLDDVLSDSASEFIAWSNKSWGYNLTLEDYDEHLAKMWQVDEDEAERRIQAYHDAEVSARYRHNQDATKVLTKLSKSYTLIITTSRNQRLEALTSAWLKKHFGDIFTGIRFAGIWDKTENLKDRVHLTKATLCQEIGASYLIDDQPKHCRAAAEVGVTSILFGDYPWNRSVELTHNMIRAKDWHEVGRHFAAKG